VLRLLAEPLARAGGAFDTLDIHVITAPTIRLDLPRIRLGFAR
jgi:hypothetical protein